MKMKTNELMQTIAKSLDEILNKPGEKKNGFVLFLFPFDGPEGARCNYVSNADRKDIIILMREMLARFEGQPELKGTA
jgi:hypothetical protein